MCYDSSCLGYLLFLILAVFTALIFFLLKIRKNTLEKNLKISADEVWALVSNEATNFNYGKADLIYGIWQDKGHFETVMVVKNDQSEIVGHVGFISGKRKVTMKVNDKEFIIDYPLTWNQTANLLSRDKALRLGSYLKLNMFGKCRFEIPGFGVITGKRGGFRINSIMNFELDEKNIGFCRQISSSAQVGKVAILPRTLPTEIRLFIMALT